MSGGEALDPLEVTRRSREALAGLASKAVHALEVGDRVAFVPTGHYTRVARHLFRCEGTVTEVTAHEVTIAWDACEDCGDPRTWVWRRRGVCWVVPK